MDTLTLILSIIGCANWGLVGLAGLWCISFLFRDRVFTHGE